MPLRANAYHTVLADPPWKYSTGPGKRGAADKHYQTLTVQQILDLGPSVQALIHPDGAHLWLWTPNAFLVDGTATRVCAAWGFDNMVTAETWAKGRVEARLPEDPLECVAQWSKIRRLVAEAGDDPRKIRRVADLIVFLLAHVRPALGQGVYLRGSSEHLVLATRGRPMLPAADVVIPTWFLARRQGHSEKPPEQYDIIERISRPPYVELFARAWHHGWDAHGLELQER